MILGVAGGLTQASYGFESLARFGAQTSNGSPAGSRFSKESEAKDAKESTATKAAQPGQLTPEQQRQVRQLQETDRNVRAHEQAHMSVGADLVISGPSFSYQTGPDNQRYAVGGEVSIDASPGRTPEETIPKAQHIRATALAPADPSPQDHRVAAKASRMEGEARIELSVQQQEQASARTDQGSMRFYAGVQQSGSSNVGVGSGLDLFA